jgi:predicted RecB family nuclease
MTIKLTDAKPAKSKGLGGYAAKQCPTRVYHDIATESLLAEPDSPGVEQRKGDGILFESLVEEVLGEHWNFFDLMELDTSGRKEAAIAHVKEALRGVSAVKIPACDRTERSKRRREILTVGAVQAGVQVIWNARLPFVNGRIGEPDAIISGLPVDVKHHRALEGKAAQKPQRVSSLETLSLDTAVDTLMGEGSPSKSDSLQLAHYIRMMEDLGLLPADAPRWGGIIGKELNVVWRPLDTPAFQGRKSALNLYDSSYETVRTVADQAMLAPENGPAVPPLWKAECKECPWRTVCHDELVEADHVSLLPGVTTARVSVYAELGITTRRGLARAVIDMPDPKVKREIDQARVSIVGKPHLARGTSTISVPRATFELDIDIEDSNGLCYLIGVADTWRRKENGTFKARTDFHAFADWTRTEEGEAKVFAEFWAYLIAQEAKATANRWGFRAYHYTEHETRYFRHLAIKHAGKPGVPTLDALNAFLDSNKWVDLHKIVSTEIVWPTENHQLKTLARYIGFDWRDEAPGGANSMAWFAQATESPDEEVREAAQRRILEYNEDDVLATLALRDWLDRPGSRPRSGNSLPAVETLDARFTRRARARRIAA